MPQHPKGELRAVNLRVPEPVRSLIDQAARAQSKSRSEFMIDAARRAAEDALLDQTVFQVDEATYEQFLKLLDEPAEPSEGVKRLLSAPAPWNG